MNRKQDITKWLHTEVTFEVTLALLNKHTKTEMKDYIKTAISQWAKGGDPNSDYWDLHVSVKTKKLPKETEHE